VNWVITADPTRIDRSAVHDFLSRQAYWSRGIPRVTVERALDHSLCFGATARTGPAPDAAATADSADAPLIGFARVVTDQATVAYLCDVYVLPAWRGRGVARALLAAILAHPQLQGLRRLLLFTRDAHGLYAGQGFTPLAHPERGMERLQADLYTAAVTPAQDLSA